MTKKRLSLSYLGECYVRLELAKREYKVISSAPGFYFDLLGQNGKKIEIKTALKSMSKKTKEDKHYDYIVWKFRLSLEQQKQHPDFYVCVLFEELDKVPIAFFIFPKGTLAAYDGKGSGMLFLYESDVHGLVKMVGKMDRHQYLNKWELITN